MHSRSGGAAGGPDYVVPIETGASPRGTAGPPSRGEGCRLGTPPSSPPVVFTCHSPPTYPKSSWAPNGHSDRSPSTKERDNAQQAAAFRGVTDGRPAGDRVSPGVGRRTGVNPACQGRIGGECGDLLDAAAYP